MKRFFIGVLLLTLGVGAWWLFFREDLPENQPIALSDGSVLHFRAVTYGTNHQYLRGGVLGSIARLLPGKWKNKFAGGARVSNPAPAMTVWWERRGLGGQGAQIEYALGEGTNYSPARTAHALSSGMMGGGIMEGLGFSSFPRRGRTVTLRVYDRGLQWGEPKLAGEFTFKNPAFTKGPGWQPETLPATKRVEDFDVTLKEVLVGVDRRRSSEFRPGTNLAEAGTFTRLQFSREGKPHHEWNAPSVQMSDATGNKASSSTWTGYPSGGNYEMIFQPYLWTDESAWRMRFELSRTTNFAAGELWTVQSIPLGATNLTNNPAFATNIQGASVRIFSLRERPGYNTTHELRVLVRPDRPDYRLTLVEAKDDLGGTAKRQGSGWGGGDHTYSLGIQTNARSLTVTLALHQSRYVEFLVAPKAVDEPAARREKERERGPR